jgi:hypothetical protein
MAERASAKKAVEIATLVDMHTGGKVHTLNIADIPDIKRRR